MKPRQHMAIFLILLLTTSTLAREIPDRLRSQQQLQQQHQRVKRQSDSAINSIMQMALRYAPLLINTIVGGGGGGGGGGGLADLAAAFLGGGGAGGAAKPAVNTKVTAVTPDKTDKIGGAAGPADIFSWSNLLSMGVKIALSLISSYASGGGIDRNGQEISPMQTVLGTVISALTGSEDPSEVATMAKQATEVIGLLGTLVDALRTSFLS